jgi:hypothetical protein
MCLNRNRDLRSLYLQVLTGFLAIAAGSSSQAQQFPGYGTANYNWSIPYGSLNYNYGFMRYGQGYVGGSSYGSMMQPQYNVGMRPSPADVYGPATSEIYQGGNQSIQEAATQALQNQRQMQAMELRYDVRQMTPKTMQSKERQANRLLPRNQVISSDGKVLWPAKAPSDGDLGKSRAEAEAAIKVAYKEFKAGGKASVQNVVEAKELLYSYGHPALEKAAGQSRQAAKGLHHFLSSLERAIDSLGGV